MTGCEQRQCLHLKIQALFATSVVPHYFHLDVAKGERVRDGRTCQLRAETTVMQRQQRKRLGWRQEHLSPDMQREKETERQQFVCGFVLTINHSE